MCLLHLVLLHDGCKSQFPTDQLYKATSCYYVCRSETHLSHKNRRHDERNLPILIQMLHLLNGGRSKYGVETKSRL